jgi:transcriptional regulator with XRE-family HTH domain
MKIDHEEKIANRLKDFRQARGLALYGLAALAGVSPTMLSAIERWGYRPRAQVCQRIAGALGVAVEEVWPVTDARSREADSPVHTKT